MKRIHLLLLLSALIPTLLYAQQVAGRLITIRGQVEVLTGAWAPATLNQDLFAGNTVRTLAQSRAVLLLADETQLKLNANTELQLQAVNESSSLITRISTAGARTEQSIMNLRSGQLYVRSKKTPARVRVNTPAVTAAIRGTEFDIQVGADGETRATVLEGSIDYRNDYGAIVVNPGEQGTARVGQAPTKTVIVNPQDAVQWTLFYTAAVSPRDYPFIDASPDQARQALSTPVSDPVRRAMLEHDAGDPAAAWATIEGVQSPEASAVRGWLLLERNQITEAQAAFTAAPPSPRVRLGLSLCALRQNDFDRALSVLNPVGDDPDLIVQQAFVLTTFGDATRALSLLAQVPRGSPPAALAESLQASILLTQNKKDEALATARAALQTSSTSPSALVTLSRVQQSFFDLPAARSAAERALALDPQFLEAQLQLARLQFGFGLTGEAERIARQALSEAPDEASAVSLLGFILLARGKTGEAESLFQKAITLDSTLGDARLGLGLVRMRRDEQLDATAELLAAATLEPRLSLYQSYLAKAFYQLRSFGQAFTALATAKELDPRDPTPYLYSGIFQDDLYRPGRAVEDFETSIRLNDNRAVYRSRLLLDRDRASRNVNLARAYRQLGLSEWGNSAAVTSELNDPTNSSAHLFLANTFLNLTGRTISGGSELLLARLLLPVNANSFNTFNDYTTLFELPRAYWTADGYYGTFDSFGGDLIATGGTNRMAYGSTFAYDRTSGFRPQNDDLKQYTGTALFKYALTPSSDILVSYANQQANEGDHGSQVLVNEFNDPNQRSFLRAQRVEVGYHRQLRPGSELLLLVSGRLVESVLDDPDRIVLPGRTFALRESTRQPNLDFEASHLLETGPFRLRYGLDVFEGRYRTHDTVLIFSPILEEPIFQEFDYSRRRIRYRTAFFRSDYRLRPNLFLSAGVNWNWTNDANPVAAEQQSTSRWNPEGGIYFSPFQSSVLRFAYFQTLQTERQETLVPAHFYGFPIALNEEPMSHSRNYNLGWDQRIGRRTFVRTFSYWRDRSLPTLDFAEQPIFFQGKLYGGSAILNQMLAEQWALTADYSLTHSLDTASLRHDQEVTLALSFVHPWGLYVTAAEDFLRQTGQYGTFRNHIKVFTTNFQAAYEFPRKIGRLAFVATNLFDRKYDFLVDPLALDKRVPARQMEVRLSVNF